MDREEVWRVIDAQRTSLTDLLTNLSDDEWKQPSLCAGWTVRDVAAHMVAQHGSMMAAIGELARARGNMDRMIHDAACRRAKLPTERLIADIRHQVGLRRHVPMITYLEVLIDVLVHSQDITIPLGRKHEIPPAAAAVAADRVWAIRAPFHAEKTFGGFRLTATDADWRKGDGPDVSAPMGALLLLLTGRSAALPHLSGAGAPALHAHLGTHS